MDGEKIHNKKELDYYIHRARMILKFEKARKGEFNNLGLKEDDIDSRVKEWYKDSVRLGGARGALYFLRHIQTPRYKGDTLCLGMDRRCLGDLISTFVKSAEHYIKRG
tara:strand:+ start:161 stop:484 length:324 start_codon:yes stop_codon:yes gene_type:complete